MLREKSKWKPHKDLSTDAEHRGGSARSSDEISVKLNEIGAESLHLMREVLAIARTRNRNKLLLNRRPHSDKFFSGCRVNADSGIKISFSCA